MKKILMPLALSLLAACVSAPPKGDAPQAAAAGFPAKPSGWLGVSAGPITDAALRSDLRLQADLPGLLVLAVMRGTPAQACGLKAGDFLSSMDDLPLSDLAQVKAAGGGSAVSFKVFSNGKPRTAACTLGFYPAVLGLKVNDTASGLTLAAPPDKVVEKAMKRLGWPGAPVLIRSMDGEAVSAIAQAKAFLSGRKPLDMVALELTDARKKYTQAVQLRLNEGAPAGQEFAEGAPASREPRTLTVSPEGSGDFRTPAGALLMSQPGDTVLLRAGRYKGGVLVSVPKRTLRGEGPSTVLEGGLFVTGAAGVTVEDLSVEMSARSADSAAAVRQARGTTLRRLTITGGHSASVEDSPDTLVEDCVMSKSQVGLRLVNSTFKVQRSVFHDNDYGVFAQNSVGTLRGLTVADNRSHGLVLEGGRTELYDSILSANPTLLQCQNACRFSGGYNDYHEGNLCGDACVPASEAAAGTGLRKETDVSVDPLFAERLKGDYRLSLESPLIGRGRGGGPIGALPPAGSGAGDEGFK